MISRTTTTTMSTSSIALFLLLSGAGQYQLAHSLEPVRLRRGQSSHSGLPARTQKARRMYHDDDIDDDDDWCDGRSSSSGLIDPYIMGDIPCLTVSDCEWKYEMLVYNHVISGYFYTDETNPGAFDPNGVKGCFVDVNGDNVYFVGGGTVKEMSTDLSYSRGQRVWCDEKNTLFEDYWLPSFSMDMSIIMHMSMPEVINW